MKSLISYYIHQFVLTIVAPFYFHFGQYAFVVDFIGILFEISDIVAFYFVHIVVLITLVYYRNTILKNLTKLNFRYSLLKNNSSPLLNTFKTCLISFKNLINNIKTFFSK
jgi:hypothetical protein